MALDVTIGNWFTELEAADKFRMLHLRYLQSLRERFTTPWYKDSAGKYDPENSIFEYVSLMLPRLCYQVPRYKVGTRGGGARKEIAASMKHGLNRWVVDSRGLVQLEAVITDMLFGDGVLLTAQKPMQGYIPGLVDQDGTLNVPEWPQWHRISPSRYGMDPLAMSQSEARYQYHKWVLDKEDLLKRAQANPDEGWNVKAIQALTDDSGLEKLKRTNPQKLSRKEVVCYEIHVPEIELDGSDGSEEGFNGTYFTVAIGMSAGRGEPNVDFIREPRPAYGPRGGPYTLFGCYSVPDDPYPLSPLIATEGQTKELNDHVRAESRRAARQKRIAIVDATDTNIGNAVAKAPDGSVIPLAGFDRNKALELVLGGPTDVGQAYIAICRDRRDRALSMSDAQRGKAMPGVTATGDQIAAISSDTRLAYVQKNVRTCTARAGWVAGWFMYHNPKVKFGLGEDAAKELGIPDPMFFGGELHKNHEVARLAKLSGVSVDALRGAFGTYDDLEIEVELMSMPYADPAQEAQKATSTFQLVTGALPLVAQFPDFPWQDLFQKLEEGLGIEGLSALFGGGVPEQMSKALQAMQQPPAMAGNGGKGGGGGVASAPSVSMPAGPNRSIAGGGRNGTGKASAPKLSSPKPAANGKAA